MATRITPYNCPPIHLEAPICPHACCKKPKSKLNFVTLDKENITDEHTVATRSISKNLQRGRSGGEGRENKHDYTNK